MPLLPPSAGGDARRLMVTRSLRGFADGLASLVLASYLPRLGLSAFAIGAVVTGTLLGSAALTLAVGLVGHRLRRRTVLFAMAGLSIATGLAFSGLTGFWPLLIAGVIGTLNPSAGDVTPFLPTEQAVLADVSDARDRTAIFAWYNLAGAGAGALGALAAGLPAPIANALGLEVGVVERCAFLVYALIGAVILLLYRGVSASVELPVGKTRTALAKSRRTVLELSALFSLDSFGGGFVVQSLLVLWLYRRFGLASGTTATIFFVTGLLAAGSQLASARLAARIGHVRTMVFTHLPSNLFLVAAGLMPNAPLAVAFILLRMAVSQMDVPARQAYVMSVVPPEERPAAASVTNVPRSLAAAVSPLLAGALLDQSTFGWPLLIGGALKVVYDLALFRRFAARPADQG
jgi:MFS family permease